MDQKVHTFQLTKIGKNGKATTTTIDFISILGQQNPEDDAEINPIEIKIENDKIQHMLEKYKNNPVKFALEGLLIDAKHGVVNRKL